MSARHNGQRSQRRAQSRQATACPQGNRAVSKLRSMQIRQSIASSNLAKHSRDSWNRTNRLYRVRIANLPISMVHWYEFVAHLALRILALPAGMPIEDFVLLRQSYSRRFAIKRTPRIIIYLSASPTYIEHIFLAQSRVFIENGNYCPLEESNSNRL